MADVHPHGAVIARCWFIQQEEPGLWVGVLHSRRNGIEFNTGVGTLQMIRETVANCYAHRGAPVCTFPVRQMEACA